MQTYTQTLQANQEYRFTHRGKYFRFLTASGTPNVRFDDGPLFDCPAGVGVPWSKGFETVVITVATAQTVTYAVSAFPIDDSRLSVSGDALEYALQHSLNAEAFEGWGNILGNAAAYGWLQLFNPAGSGVNAYVYALGVRNKTGVGLTHYDLGINEADLVNVLWNVDGKNVNTAVTSACEWRANAAKGLPAPAHAFRRVQTSGSIYTDVKFSQPIILHPGDNLTIAPNTQNIDTEAYVEFVEVAA